MKEPPDFDKSMALLRRLEEMNGGVDGLNKIVQRINAYPAIYNALIGYLKACITVVIYGGMEVEKMATIITHVLQKCFSDENLQILDLEIKAIKSKASTQDLEKSKNDLQAVMTSLGFPENEKVVMNIPDSVVKAVFPPGSVQPLPKISKTVH